MSDRLSTDDLTLSERAHLAARFGNAFPQANSQNAAISQWLRPENIHRDIVSWATSGGREPTLIGGFTTDVLGGARTSGPEPNIVGGYLVLPYAATGSSVSPSGKVLSDKS